MRSVAGGSWKQTKGGERPMLGLVNESILVSACSGVLEARRCLVRGQVYTAAQCCREAGDRFMHVLREEDVEIAEVEEYVKERMAYDEAIRKGVEIEEVNRGARLGSGIRDHRTKLQVRGEFAGLER